MFSTKVMGIVIPAPYLQRAEVSGSKSPTFTGYKTCNIDLRK
jgi:hypothetical protein